MNEYEERGSETRTKENQCALKSDWGEGGSLRSCVKSSGVVVGTGALQGRPLWGCREGKSWPFLGAV